MHEVLDIDRVASGDMTPVSTFEVTHRFWKFGDETVSLTTASCGSAELIHRRGTTIADVRLHVADSPEIYFQTLGANQVVLPDFHSSYGVAPLLYELGLAEESAMEVSHGGDLDATDRRAVRYTHSNPMAPFTDVEYANDILRTVTHYNAVNGFPFVASTYHYGDPVDSGSLPASVDVRFFLSMIETDEAGNPTANYDMGIQTHQIYSFVEESGSPAEGSIGEVVQKFGSELSIIGRLELHNAAFEHMARVIKPTMHSSMYNGFMEIPQRYRENPHRNPSQITLPGGFLSGLPGLMLIIGAGFMILGFCWFLIRRRRA